MILTAHQPVYLPWLGLFHKIAVADRFVLFDRVQYVPKDWINRNKINTPTGAVLLTVPVIHKDHFNKKIDEIEINPTENWRQKHWRSIYLNYKNTHYFKRYSDFLEDVYNREWKYLADLNHHMLLWFLKELNIKTPVLRAKDLDFKGAKSDLVLDMCLTLKTQHYIFGQQGENYADIENFIRNGVKVYFQHYNHPVYKQQYGDFIPYMSVLDLMFNEGDRSLEIIMKDNPTTYVAKEEQQ